MNELVLRTATALVLLALAYAWFFLMPPAGFHLLLALIAAGLCWEGARMLSLPAAWLHALAAVVGYGLALQIGMLAAFVATALVGAAMLAAMRTKASHAGFFAQGWIVLWTVAACACVALAHATPAGRDWLIGAALVVWGADIVAYLVGRSVGRHRLCPAISPGKTVEGALAGIVAAGAIGAAWWGAHAWGLWQALEMALLVALAGMLGDLSISSAKRLAGVKDSGHWLPGHGGLLDRFDALLLALPLGWIAWR